MPETIETEEDDWLDKDGICFFPGPEAKLPSEIRISSPDLGVLDLVSGLIVKNPKGPGVITIPYNSIENEKDPLPAKIIGAVVDAEMVKTMMDADPDFIQLKDPNGLTWMSLDAWHDMFGTNGLALIIRMRLFWKAHGGGVTTPGQQVTAAGQVGHVGKVPKDVTKLGGQKPSKRL